ncbi:hypothetical protein ICN48_09455 [Polynucleobacter sp. JS-Safj-400b-B2]|uniref:hypothetical protein n=1 Tax=Polynucleobacter sp. JS-Safj-400b-B2 TaxID=2576921 RepID=UPI001C0BC017|nr:hypothetical protein [Polynucleobacter sp. JS-Safj-400b-B2]MBU3626459.1 hypothetical protein [Polynucleobacter sp. JS-Safj-400b-B2]
MNSYVHDVSRRWDSLTRGKKIIASVIFGGILSLTIYAGTQLYVHSITQKIGYQFEHAPVLTGVFNCCGGVENYPVSTVGGVKISCAVPSYTGPPPAAKFSDFSEYCNFKQLNGISVIVERVWIGHFAYVTKISTKDQTYFQRTDEQLRQEWVSTSRLNNLLLCILFPLVLVVVLIIKIFNEEQ